MNVLARFVPFRTSMTVALFAAIALCSSAALANDEPPETVTPEDQDVRRFRVVATGKTNTTVAIQFEPATIGGKYQPCPPVQVSVYNESPGGDGRWTTPRAWKTDQGSVPLEGGPFGTCSASERVHAGKLYRFHVNPAKPGASPRRMFRALPDGQTPFSFVAGGDSKEEDGVGTKKRQRAFRLIAELRPSFVAFGGDMVEALTRELIGGWLDDWELTRSKDGYMPILVPQLGNHETYSSTGLKVYRTDSAKNFCGLFALPCKEQGGAKAAFYEVRIGTRLSFLTLDTEIYLKGRSAARARLLAEQLDWTKNRLRAAKDVRWRVIQYHRPMYSQAESAKGTHRAFHHDYAELFGAARVRLAIESDGHVNKFTHPVVPHAINLFERSAKGTVYMGEGTMGSNPRDCWSSPRPWVRYCGSEDQFKWVTVGASEIRVWSVMYNEARPASERPPPAGVGMPHADLPAWVVEKSGRPNGVEAPQAVIRP
ncbi:MAG: hypothetical protein ACI9OJ_004476 [Myxococcota bacterium]|jgi:hypothetical protein